jgi:iron complex outermembrane receptor protein
MSIEITINRIKEKAFEASGTVYVITEQDIKIKGYKDLKDILVEIPGSGFAGYTGDVDMTRVRVRGITENMKILVIKDGAKLNNPSGTPLTWGNNLPLHDIEQIEIVIGPASVMYGQNTYSALVNLKTKREKHVRVETAGGSYKTVSPACSF